MQRYDTDDIIAAEPSEEGSGGVALVAYTIDGDRVEVLRFRPEADAQDAVDRLRSALATWLEV